MVLRVATVVLLQQPLAAAAVVQQVMLALQAQESVAQVVRVRLIH
jgi:hypothetical protein